MWLRRLTELHIDGMMYTRGSSDDYNLWGKVSGNSRWSWKNLFPYFLKVNLTPLLAR
jgi:choline dehydrogenase-like flavoprotein